MRQKSRTRTWLLVQPINKFHKNPLPSLFVCSQTLPMGEETASILWAAGSRLCIFLAHVIPQVPSFLLFFNSLLLHVAPSHIQLWPPLLLPRKGEGRGMEGRNEKQGRCSISLCPILGSLERHTDCCLVMTAFISLITFTDCIEELLGSSGCSW